MPSLNDSGGIRSNNIRVLHNYIFALHGNMFSIYGTNVAGGSCTDGDLSVNAKCYRKFNSQLTWYSASNECLSRGGSLAVFTDIGRPSDNNQLITWLNSTGTDKTYWIGLIRSWWKTTNNGNTWLAYLYMTLVRYSQGPL